MHPIRIAISAGEPAGVGPELLTTIAESALTRYGADVSLIAISDPQLLTQAAAVTRANIALHRFDPNEAHVAVPGQLLYVPQSLAQPNEFGFLRRSNAHFVINVLQRAAMGCISGEFDAMVTGPVHKGVINDAGIAFTGHTEYLQKLAHAEHVVMLLATPKLRVALATTHIPIKQVSAALTRTHLTRTISTLAAGLRTLGIADPRILVLGLNPHAGESGHIGDEEINVITPTLDALRKQGLQLIGPVSADTAFLPKRLSDVDCVLAMYHDQGLPVLKTQGFGEAINISLGLPFIRTSVDHGTALELAGKGVADAGSFQAALVQAVDMARIRRKHAAVAAQ
jgi:4-hydroxythreonine-4-phosphate dehydrogenase